jgi:hypothetical protein
MTTALTPFVPQNLEQADKLSQQLAKSALLPDSLRNKPGDVLVVLMTGAELGLSPMQAIRGLHVIKGKAVMSADLQVALTKRHPDCVYFRLVQSTPAVATYETQRKGEPEPTSMSFTIQDATQANLTGGDNWRKYPAAMLRARCAAALARAVFPDLMLGAYEEDEAKSFGYKPEQELNRPPLELDESKLDGPIVEEGQIVAAPEASARETREPVGRVAVARAKAEAKLAEQKAATPPEQEKPAATEEIVTPFQRLSRLAKKHGLSMAQIAGRAKGATGKDGGFTHEDINRVEDALEGVAQ